MSREKTRRSPSSELDARDLEEIRRHGIDAAEARRQLALLRQPPPRLSLVAPCTRGDGVEVLDESTHDALLDGWSAAARNGRLTKFVPASGAATRMFAALDRARLDGAAAVAELDEFLTHIRDFPFYAQLETAVAGRGQTLERLLASGRSSAILDCLLDADGLAYAATPKALIPFHRGPEGARTAIDEHLREAGELIADRQGRCRLHFTVSPDHKTEIERALTAAAPADRSWELSTSVQSPATDTLALDAAGRPFRTEEDRLLLRAGGHGALLRNLEGLAADLVVLKNIDNVQPRRDQPTGVHWQRLLVGRLLELETGATTLLQRLDDPADRSAATDGAAFVDRHFRRAADAAAALDTPQAVARALRRPLRVCGVVRNQGEPGGGPFWASDGQGQVSRQIVETAEISPARDQRQILASSTHFNPVLMALALRAPTGGPYRLADFVDRSRVFISRKSWQGRELRALEHPGLWNGSMAAWNTLFVEVPEATFTPVKTVFDLLRPEHRG